MINIGMFYGRGRVATEAYRKHCLNANSMAREFSTVTCNPRKMTITYNDDVRYMYYAFENEGDAQARVAGINFQAIFSEGLHDADKQYLLTRFRPVLS